MTLGDSMTFTALLKEITATYSDRSRAFHVLATRYYIGAETRDTLKDQATVRPCHKFTTIGPYLTADEVNEIIRNR